MMERKKLTTTVAGVTDQLTSIIPFCTHFHTQNLIFQVYICQIRNVNVDCWVYHHCTSTPRLSNHASQLPWSSYYSKNSDHFQNNFMKKNLSRSEMKINWLDGKAYNQHHLFKQDIKLCWAVTWRLSLSIDSHYKHKNCGEWGILE